MGNYTILGRFENPRRGRQVGNLTTNVPKILDLKSSSEQIFSENCRWVPLYSYEARHTFLLFLFVTFFGLYCALSSKIHVILNLLTKRNVALVLSCQNW